MAMIDWVDKWAKFTPNKICLRESESGLSITYCDLNLKSIQFGHFLVKEYKLRKGDRIAILAEFSINFVALFSLAQKSGFILVPLNYRLSKEELLYQINDSEAKLLLYDCTFKDSIDFDRLPSNSLSFDKLPSSSKDHTIPKGLKSEMVTEDDPVFILYTSGTTGKPKGCIYTHKMCFWNSINTELRLDITSNDHTLVCMPPFHTGGWNVLLTPFLHHGAEVSLMKKFDADKVLNYLSHMNCTIFMAVPTMLKMMSESQSFNEVNLNSMRYFIVGGESMLLSQIELWQNKGIPVRQGYGLTEVGPNITSLNEEDAIRKKGSIGKPNFYVETRIVLENGADAAINQDGELWLKGPMCTPGYWKNSNETAKAFSKDGWFKTGDILVKDEEGFFYVKDRIKNMFISGGENVYPAEVEEVLSRFDLIEDVAVIGVPNEKWGEVGMALIVPKTKDCKDHEIIDFCRDKLAKFKIPKKFKFIDQIPKTDSGKVDRKLLLKFYL